jgi:cobalt/nickel transport protein
MRRQNIGLLVLVLMLVMLPLCLPLVTPEPFSGADGQAEAAIVELHPDYQPWFQPLWEPPSGEIASLLFAVQAALGAGVLGYYLGLRCGRARQRNDDSHAAD